MRRLFKVSWGVTLPNGNDLEKGRGETEAPNAGYAVGRLRTKIPRGMDWIHARLVKEKEEEVK